MVWGGCCSWEGALEAEGGSSGCGLHTYWERHVNKNILSSFLLCQFPKQKRNDGTQRIRVCDSRWARQSIQRCFAWSARGKPLHYFIKRPWVRTFIWRRESWVPSFLSYPFLVCILTCTFCMCKHVLRIIPETAGCCCCTIRRTWRPPTPLHYCATGEIIDPQGKVVPDPNKSNPCLAAKAASYKCANSGGDCQDFYDAYNACKSRWYDSKTEYRKLKQQVDRKSFFGSFFS